jgi:LysR family transcriptional regulator (chromosome initiation inhibitor)
VQLQSEQLRTFSAVLDTGTFEAAATELRVTPSAVSQRIKGLEVTVGRVLLERTKPVRPTQSGEVVLRLARQLALLEDEATAALAGGDGSAAMSALPVVINADSLNTWVMPVLAEVSAARNVCFEVFRDDQDHSTTLLRSGAAMAAITSEASPVQGCTVRRLGRMRYRPVASPAVLARWFPDGVTPEALAVAPTVAFDRLDQLQDRYLVRRARRPLRPPRHYVPASADYVEALRLGMGWGVLPPAQSSALLETGELVEMDPGRFVDVTLYWQQWKLRSPAVDALADAIMAAAKQHLG